MSGQIKVIFGGPLTGKSHFLKHLLTLSTNKSLLYIDCLKLQLNKYNFEKTSTILEMVQDYFPGISFLNRYTVIFDQIDHLD
jgi:hypothetical protein